MNTRTRHALTSTAPSGAHAADGEPVILEVGDVVVPVLGGAAAVRVVDEADAGAALGRGLALLRPEPTALDPWFLAGFLRSTANNRRASSYASTATRLVAPAEPDWAVGTVRVRTHVLSWCACDAHSVIVMQLRYAFRLYPDTAQRMALARAFGCASVVFNDAVRAREDARRAGAPFPKAAELSQKLITQAKQTAERSWLGEVS
ncbi:helix-turn-helix domain-containing protein, partial [Streptomyces sp. NPDC002790]|uniref:helix-turn-helix domain-containing protein n=1 Tax=Streptomyces sp. NPDC002790 TaxID=3154431 RepID=UPI00331BC18E